MALGTEWMPQTACANSTMKLNSFMNTNLIRLNLLLFVRSFQVAYLRLKLRYLIILKGEPLRHDSGRTVLVNQSLKPSKEFHGDTRMTSNDPQLSHADERQNQ